MDSISSEKHFPWFEAFLWEGGGAQGHHNDNHGDVITKLINKVREETDLATGS